MDKSTRIRLIQQVRDALSSMGWEDTDLLLEEFGFGTFPSDATDLTVTSWLRSQGGDDDLVALGRHLAVPAVEDAANGVPAWSIAGSEPGRLLLFASHLSTERRFVGEVESGLAAFGITLFVAHDSIPIDADWQPEIAEALRQCDAGAVFVHEGLHDSYYCMQEVGWLLGRDVPIARLLFDDSPKGLLGSKQGINAHAMKPAEVAVALLDYVATKPELAPQLATSLVHAMKDSPSFHDTDAAWERLKLLGDLSLQQCTTLLEAAEEQSQVYRANVGGWSGPAYRTEIAAFLEGEPASAPLADRIAALRERATDGRSLRRDPGDLRDLS